MGRAVARSMPAQLCPRARMLMRCPHGSGRRRPDQATSLIGGPRGFIRGVAWRPGAACLGVQGTWPVDRTSSPAVKGRRS